MNDAERKLVEDLEWQDEEYRLVREVVGDDLFRVRLVHRQTQRKLSVPGRFHTRVTAARAAELHLAIIRLQPPPEPATPAPLRINDDAYTECAVLHIGDWHVGKEETNETTFPARVARIRDRLIELRERTLSAYHIPEMLIAITGDMVDGQGVYPTQAYNQAISDPREQARLCGEHLADLIDALRPYYGAIRVAGVPGNHGSAGKFMPDSANYDLLVYDILAQRLAGKVPVLYNPGDPWILRTHVAGDYHALLYHGHKRIGRTIKQAQDDIARWNLIEQFHPFRYVFVGHLHHLFELEYNGIQLQRTGTMLIDDPYSREMGYQSSVKARLFGVNTTKRDREITWTFRVDLT